MNKFSQDFGSFCSTFTNKEFEKCLVYLSSIFKADPKQTLLKLYQGSFIFNPVFLDLSASCDDIPNQYVLLFKLTGENNISVEKASLFLKELSQRQILQGVANDLEKRNVELKYNEAWNIKYANGDARYLETERQAVYFSSAGIEFQELLKRYYVGAIDDNNTALFWDANIENSFSILLQELGIYCEIKDTIERHLFFDWSLSDLSGSVLKTEPPKNQREGKIETDIINLLKSKYVVEGLENTAQINLNKRYLDQLKNGNRRSNGFWNHQLDINNSEEMEWFAEALCLDGKADLTVERELALLCERYFPGIKELKELELDNGVTLPLRETFRILGFISELSKKHLAKSQQQYTGGVNHYSQRFPTSPDASAIDLNATLFKGNNEAIKKSLEEHYNEQVYVEQQKIISYAKKEVKKENCLIAFDFEKLIKTIQRIHQYESDFIRKVIEIFIYDESRIHDVTRAPFFKIDKDLCWMPYMVAYVSFGENLIENLIAKNLISIHRAQTTYYEKNISNLFAGFGYKVISKDENKCFRGPDGKALGDFDLLAYKEGVLIYMELKLSNTRNSYFERWNWKENKLSRATEQLGTAIKFIHENPQHIKNILGLTLDDEINEINTFIISNSFLYDHEKIREHQKISYFEAVYTLILTEKMNHGDKQNAAKYVQRIKENWLFNNLETAPITTNETVVKVGDYSILRPGLIQQNLNTVL